MKRTLCYSVALALAAIVSGFTLLAPPSGSEPVLANEPCRAQAAANLTAVISSLPNEVSNGTPTQLDGRDSHVDGGYIVSYAWKIEHAGSSPDYLAGMTQSYTFADLGAYEVTLNVTDNETNSAETVVEVYAVVDVDLDGLPDWWEGAYFGDDLDAQDGAGDPDDDGYTNLQEYASETDPTVWDERPTFGQTLADNWYYLVAVVAAVVVVVALLWPRMRKRRKELERKKIEAALEIEKALGEEEK